MEIVVVCFLIVVLSAILITNFPQLQKQLALSRAAYKMAEDLRKMQDLGLSGLTTYDSENPAQAIPVKGYGLHINMGTSIINYYLYADVATNLNPNGSKTFDSSLVSVKNCSKSYNYSNGFGDTGDCLVDDAVDISKQNSDLYIVGIYYMNGATPVSLGSTLSINFSPPDPIVTITPQNALPAGTTEIYILLGLKSSSITRKIWINGSGLIRIE